MTPNAHLKSKCIFASLQTAPQKCFVICAAIGISWGKTELQTLQMRDAHVPCLVSVTIALYSTTQSWSNWIFRYRLMG